MNRGPDRNSVKHGKLFWATVALVATVVCVTLLGSVAGALAGNVAVGAVAGAIWGLFFGLLWVLPVFFLRRRGKNEGHMRDPGYYGGGEGGGYGSGQGL